MFYVCIDAGDFDILLNESRTETAAIIFVDRIQKLSKLKLEIKTECRQLIEEFETEEILTGHNFEKLN